MAYARCTAIGSLLTLQRTWLCRNHQLMSSIAKSNNKPKLIRNNAIRVSKPTHRDGWYKRFRHRLYMNSQMYKSRFFSLLSFTIFTCGAGLLIRYVVDAVKTNKSIKLAKDELRYVDERDVPDVKLATPATQIQISEERGRVFVSYLFLSSWRVKKFELSKCLFDEDGNIVLDKVGFPLLWDQPNTSWLPRSLR